MEYILKDPFEVKNRFLTLFNSVIGDCKYHPIQFKELEIENDDDDFSVNIEFGNLSWSIGFSHVWTRDYHGYQLRILYSTQYSEKSYTFREGTTDV